MITEVAFEVDKTILNFQSKWLKTLHTDFTVFFLDIFSSILYLEVSFFRLFKRLIRLLRLFTSVKLE